MNTENNQLVRGLGLAAATSIVVGTVIGTGIFLKARVMMCNVESPGWMIFAWVAAGLLSLAGALTYSELAAMMPKAGGEYARGLRARAGVFVRLDAVCRRLHRLNGGKGYRVCYLLERARGQLAQSGLFHA
jgi:hypothetical protein